MSLNNFVSVLRVITEYEPAEVYNLAGQTSVGLSFEQPLMTIESISTGTLNLLEAIRLADKKIRLFSAGSGDVFGNTGIESANEDTVFRPRSPYAVAKASAFWQVENYRKAYGLFACTGILFNHESPLLPQYFVTQKIINGAKEIAAGNLKNIVLGNLGITRDWGWAPEYVGVMWLMLQMDDPEDFIIATGTSFSLEDFVRKVFEYYGFDWKKFVQVDYTLFRPLDIGVSRADPSKAKNKLGWHASIALDRVIHNIIESPLC
jgi:GDPmannose 4,6-dehydratase